MIFSSFGWQPHHKIEFNQGPARGVNPSHCLQQIAFGDPLVDHITQALTARLRGQGETSLAYLADLLNHPLIQRSHP